MRVDAQPGNGRAVTLCYTITRAGNTVNVAARVRVTLAWSTARVAASTRSSPRSERVTRSHHLRGHEWSVENAWR